MAFIIFKDRRCKFVSAEQGAVIWRVMNQEIKGTKKQRNFVSQIKNIFLNPDNAPKSYLRLHPVVRNDNDYTNLIVEQQDMYKPLQYKD